MQIPIVAIIGRPNVGKSTIFNRMVKKKLAIVDKESGVTRDRKYQIAEWSGQKFFAVDTGGMVPFSNDKMEKSILLQAELAINEADIIVFVLDCKTGITALDEHITKKLYPISTRIVTVVNKIDHQIDEPLLYEFMRLGLGEPIGISAISGRNFGDFLDKLIKTFPHFEEDFSDEKSIKIAVVGKPNVGKSSLVNKIIGQDAVIVTEMPGTTRDSIHLNFNYNGNLMTLIDTAGLRKKSSVKYGIEYFSNIRSIQSIESSDIVLLLLDAQETVTSQDKRIAEYASRKHKEIILVVNKWDLVEKDNSTTGKFVLNIREEMDFLGNAPIIFLSALTGQRIKKLLELIMQVEARSYQRISTSQLNKFLEKIVRKNPPKHPSRKYVKFYFCTQAEVHPPTFIFSVNDPKLITENFKRYIQNQIREEFDFDGVSFRLKFKGHNE